MNDEVRVIRPTTTAVELSFAGRVKLAARVWVTYLRIRWELARYGVPRAADRLAKPDSREPVPVALLSRAVSRALRIGPWQPRCLFRSFVLFRLLRAQGLPADLLIGLASGSRDVTAHAWVELEGRDVGPAPGQMGHQAMARYPVRQ